MGLDLDLYLEPESKLFEVGTASGISSFGSTTLFFSDVLIQYICPLFQILE